MQPLYMGEKNIYILALLNLPSFWPQLLSHYSQIFALPIFNMVHRITKKNRNTEKHLYVIFYLFTFLLLQL